MITQFRPRASALALAIAFATGSAFVASPALQAKPVAVKNVDIPYQEFTLKNGLRPRSLASGNS